MVRCHALFLPFFSFCKLFLNLFRYMVETMVTRMNDHVVEKMSADVNAMAEKLKKSVAAIEKAMPKIHASPKKVQPPPPQDKEEKKAVNKKNEKAFN